MLEADFQKQIVNLAHLYGWKVQHSRPAMLPGGGWATHGIDSGFPDLVLAHPEKGVIIAELKSQKGRVSESQMEWILALRSELRVHLWRPSDFDSIIETLKKGTPKK
jgi:hypothetical protein